MAFGKFELFVANKFIRQGNSSKKTRPVIQISIIAIALSTAVIILTATVVNGFKSEITNKVIGFGAHIEVSHYRSVNSYETFPIDKNENIEGLEGSHNIKHIQPYVIKAGILKNGENIQANVLKGINEEFDKSFFKKHMVRGEFPKNLESSILISLKTANLLDIDVGEKILLYFIQDPPRVRKLDVVGIYESGFSQFDDLMAMTDIKMLQKINGWDETQLSGYEMLLNDFDALEESTDFVYNNIPSELNAQSIFEKFPDIFNWLELQDVNYYIILILMILVAVINSISALIILILEKTSIIGTLKTLGSNNSSIKRIFIIQGAYLLLTGLFWGNLFGVGMALIQEKFKIITLPVESYFLSSVPIKLDMMELILINGGAFVICMSALIIPSHMVTGVVIAKAIKFDQ